MLPLGCTSRTCVRGVVVEDLRFALRCTSMSLLVSPTPLDVIESAKPSGAGATTSALPLALPRLCEINGSLLIIMPGGTRDRFRCITSTLGDASLFDACVHYD